MKQYMFRYVSLVVLFITFSCVNTPKQKKIQGNVDIPLKDFRIAYGMNMDEIQMDSLGNYTVDLNDDPEGVYRLLVNGMSFPIYINDNTNLTLNISKPVSRNIFDAISLSGDNIENTELLFKYKRQKDSLFLLNKRDIYQKIPLEFEKYINVRMESILDWIDNFVVDNNVDNKQLIEYLKLQELSEAHYLFYYYPNDHKRYVPNNTDITPEYFKTYYNNQLDKDSKITYMGSDQFAMIARGKYNSQLREKLIGYDPNSLQYQKKMEEALSGMTYPEYMKNDLYTIFIINYGKTTNPEIKPYLTKIINEHVTSGVLFERWKAFVKSDKMFSNGDIAPNFTLTDIDGNKISLSDFRGKLVYIDLWATWCGPCLKEMPDLKKLKEKYKDSNIVFIGISLDDDIETWKKMLEKEGDNFLTGIQLATGQYETQLNKDYGVNGIPHFILIDRDGTLIAKKAPRPSNNKIFELIDSKL
ncbi:TlpA family protein disulfide reductase [Aestuariibaculum sp. M13]|uniref:TlpA family protein disulfide reductase n=1 Tax=Aestuariibaculum sp. M13 TaxID=2967132 RepID=UPI002159E4F4|nr:TlpA disulfide reductase family protein [Aestuariibaculum sp. M13]MCR8668942.1 TlpA family protein disulfide reductase [Aestuariibaculum sp. M13]